MYLPPLFKEVRLNVLHALIGTNPLGLLITAGPGGLIANHLPFVIDPASSERGTLRVHLARANRQVQELAAVDDCLIVFSGPAEYITPSWYPTKTETGKVVPTWNFVTVHAWGRPAVIDDAGWLRGQIEDLTRLQELPREDPWEVADAPASFINAQLKGIIGVEIPIDRIEGKWKVSQNRNEADRAGVETGLRESGESGEAMANLVKQGGAIVP